MTEVNKPYEYTNDGDDLGKHVTKVIEFAFERCLFADLRCDRLVDMANRGAFANQDYDGFRATIDDGRTL
jgi:hypothetical protein